MRFSRMLFAAVVAVLPVVGLACAPTRAAAPPPTTTPTLPASGATRISGRWLHTCAVIVGGTVKCWGYNGAGALGDGGTETNSPIPVQVVGVTGATDVAAGDDHTSAIVGGGGVKCWGLNVHGELGDGIIPVGTNPYSLTAVDVVGVSGATHIAAGTNHTCAIVGGGRVKCWGWDGAGDLGDGGGVPSSTAVDVIGLTGATQISAGGDHTCVLVAGIVKCWGANDQGQLGNGAISNSSIPVDATGVTGATQISAGDRHTCAVLAAGAVKCWGLNANGQLGNATTTTSNTPVDVTGVVGATHVGGGVLHTCAVVAAGAVKCWGGYGLYGALGNGGSSDSSTAVDVVDVTGATQVTGGFHRSCAIVAAGAVKCWGYNYDGELGDGHLYYDSLVPVSVVGIP